MWILLLGAKETLIPYAMADISIDKLVFHRMIRHVGIILESI